MKRTASTKSRGTQAPTRLSKTRLAEMIEKATIDAYGESEQLTGWFTMFEEYLVLPFETTVLGTTVTVASIELRDGAQMVAICTRGRYRQALSPTDLPLPTPAPAGSEWIQAYPHWLGRR